MTNSFLVSLFEHKAWANRNMYAVMRAIRQEKRAGGVAYAVLVLAHASLVDRVFRARLIGEAQTLKAVIPSEMPDIDALAETVRVTDEWYLGYVRSVSDAELSEIVEFDFLSDDDKGRMAKEEMLAHVLTHSAAHRAQVGGLLDKAEIKGPPEMFTTFLSTRGC
jgi:uncharacterized damage-inducible protein DinB